MKKWLGLVYVVLILGISLTACSAGTFTYVENDDGTITITGYSKNAETITIPIEIDGKRVIYYSMSFLESSPRLIHLIRPANVGIDHWMSDEELAAFSGKIEYELLYRVGDDDTVSIASIWLFDSLDVTVEIPSTICGYEVTSLRFLDNERGHKLKIVVPSSITEIYTVSYYRLKENIVFVVEEGSYAHEWAVENGFNYELK